MSDIKADDIQLEHAPSTTHPSGAADHDAGDSSSFHDSYRMFIRTYMVLITMAFAWGTCTMANIGPATTYSYTGSLADRFGKKWFILSGGVADVIGNVVAGFAKSTEVIIAGQALNGLGSSLYVRQLIVSG
ncbi:hypothetical protein NW754_004538 [Fusarium falciforme]|nr:hypothetical protein NW754_004538 [Fusarium falciforme]